MLNDQSGTSCVRTPLRLCDPCYNEYTHFMVWMVRVPEYQTMIVLVSSPVALLVALYGMTSQHLLQLVKSSSMQKELLTNFRE
jgi:hypothetical protein